MATEEELRKMTPKGEALRDLAWKHAAEAMGENIDRQLQELRDENALLRLEIALNKTEPGSDVWSAYGIKVNDELFVELFVSYYDAVQAIPRAVEWLIGRDNEMTGKITSLVIPVDIREAPDDDWAKDATVEIKLDELGARGAKHGSATGDEDAQDDTGGC